MPAPHALLTAALAGLLASAAGCATLGDDPALPEGAVETTRTEPNGDVITEFRVAGQLRALRVVPSRGATYFLFDRNGDGVVDRERDGVQPVYFKLFGWD